MKIAIMQPYIFPYLGYFQLVSAVDKFIFFDDVNFIKKGWINKNKILQHNKILNFTVPLISASQNRKINEIQLYNYQNWRKEFILKIDFCYKKSPNFIQIRALLKHILYMKEFEFISTLAETSVKSICSYLGLNTKFLNSSNLVYNRIDTNGQQKIININKLLNASHYINSINGKSLYENKIFSKYEIKLNFIKMCDIVYHQNNPNFFFSNLSIVDILMFNSISQIKCFLNNFKLE